MANKAIIESILPAPDRIEVSVTVRYEVDGTDAKTEIYRLRSKNDLESVLPETIKSEIIRLISLTDAYNSAKELVGGHFTEDGVFHNS